MSQLFICIFGFIAVFLSQQKNKKGQKFACIFGLAGQPFWFYSTLQAEQWGIFVLSIFYTWCWCLGLKNNWFTK